ncbi:MAG: hypothetical protein M1813_000388 [Trichoglossum hirsutum]|nr:MAG: hypothetical protein M1813_000388 [Trichoglossum hirsutum]
MATHKFIVGVDFGTTYTGVSCVPSSKTGLRDVSIIQDWPGPSREAEVTYKTPTRIAYPTEGNERFCTSNTIGYSVTPKMKSHSWFKLLLDRSAATRFDDPSLRDTEGPGILRLPRGKTAQEVCADYLREIFQTVMSKLEKQVSAEVLRITAIEFWFTVPAIWSDSAKQGTLAAARTAGFGTRPGDEVNLISEPEAAAIATLKWLTSDGAEDQITPGDGVLICDCGGGTVDITTYLIRSVLPELSFEELLVGEGGKCGSTYIDRQFHQWMSNKFGDKFNNLPFSNKGPGSRFMKEFECCKRDYGSNSDVEYEFTLVMKDVEDSEFYDADQGLVKMHRQWSVNHGVPRVVCPDRPQAAVVLGAALRGLCGLKPKSRRCRRHYGFQLDLAYDPKLDDERNAYLNQYDRTKRIRGTMVWSLPMGSVVDEDTFICQRVMQPWFKGESLVFSIPLYSCSAEVPPRREDHPRVQRVGMIKVDLQTANLNKFKKRWKITQDRWVWELRYEIQIMFGKREGILCFRAKNGNDVVGNTQIEYSHD